MAVNRRASDQDRGSRTGNLTGIFFVYATVNLNVCLAPRTVQ